MGGRIWAPLRPGLRRFQHQKEDPKAIELRLSEDHRTSRQARPITHKGFSKSLFPSQQKSPALPFKEMGLFPFIWCGTGDSNPHASRHKILSLTRLPLRQSRRSLLKEGKANYKEALGARQGKTQEKARHIGRLFIRYFHIASRTTASAAEKTASTSPS